MSNNNSCSCMSGIIGNYMYQIQQLLQEVNRTISNAPNYSTSIGNVERMLAHDNPMTIAGEYPEVKNDIFVVSCPNVRFLDLLNTNIYVIFKIDNNSNNLPVYFKDSVDYEHRVVVSNGTPVLTNQLQLNGIYSAKFQYDGGYIILDSLTPLNPNVIL